MGFHHVGQAGLELLTCDPPALASQSAGITGVSHHAWSFFFEVIEIRGKDKSNGNKNSTEQSERDQGSPISSFEFPQKQTLRQWF